MVRKLFDAEKEIVLRESVISERINKLWNDMLIYELYVIKLKILLKLFLNLK